MLNPLRQWPNDWTCDRNRTPKLRVFASALRDLFHRCLLDQIQCRRSPSTIRRHRNELHTLGHECIRSLTVGASRRVPADARSYLVSLELDQGGPPLSFRNATLRDQIQFDTTCRVLARWMARHA
ncbi:hypothetical protein B1806_03995 [Metallibacterium scheffleri]|uniref:Integrase n=2 Tax=Metallibacterium scheffleri TaxID=993689 RepID=A0A4S3KS37_9GAMM|nr:hypothetical protein B1806_03995 [Metallibacterium scheffleri]